MDNNRSWYAIKIFTSANVIRGDITSRGMDFFVPTVGGKPVVRSLALVRCTPDEILDLKYMWYTQMMVYKDPEGNAPQAVSDHEMFVFMLALHAGGDDLIPLVVTDRKILEGQRVRVTDGPLKDVEGVVKRIKGDRRLIVSIGGIAALATVHISKNLLEPIEGTGPEQE